MSHGPSLTGIADLNGRYDIYGAIHKGLRKAQCDLLVRTGCADFADAGQTEKLLADFRDLLTLAASHVTHEDTHIHSALKERNGSTETVDDQHDDHRKAFATLRGLIRDVEEAPVAQKAAAGRKLYLAFAAYVSEDFAHMHEEETVTAPALWARFSDEDLLGIEMRIVGSLSPEKTMAFMRLMIPAMNPDERAAMLAGMKMNAPAEAFNAVIEFAARPNLSAGDFSDLAKRLDLAA